MNNDSSAQSGPLGEAGARLRALVAQLKWEAVAARSAVEFARLYVRLFCRHTEAVSECPHCNLVFLASYASRSADVFATAELEALLSAPFCEVCKDAHPPNEPHVGALLSAPVVSPPLPVCKECGCQTGGGEYCYEHKPYTVTPLKDGTFRVDRFGMQRISFEEPPSAPVVTQEGEEPCP